MRQQALPLIVDQSFERLKFNLVRHFRALCDVVTQIQIGQTQFLNLINLPEDAVGAIARADLSGIVKGIDR
ncbi:MAG: hypothetical protein RLZZ119_619 [Pseudomonadota bacterium]